MMLVFTIEARCIGCDQAVKGTQLAFPKRINLGSIVIEQSLYTLQHLCEGTTRNDPRPGFTVLSARLDEKSAAAVEQARGRIRDRRKKAAA